MPPGVLVIESPDSPLLRRLQAVLGWTDEIVSHRFGWADIRPHQVAEHDPDLLLAIAVPEPDEATRVFRWLPEHANRMVRFAVLPGGCRDELLCEAAGAVDDFVLWPGRIEEFQSRLARVWPPAARNDEAELAHLAGSPGVSCLIGRDPTFRELVRKLACVAATHVPVLLSGETGTGKELCARALRGAAQVGRRAWGDGADTLLEQHPAGLDGVEVVRIGRHELHLGAYAFDQCPHRHRLVRRQIVHDDDVAGLQPREQPTADPGHEPRRVDRPPEGRRRHPAREAHRPDQTQVVAPVHRSISSRPRGSQAWGRPMAPDSSRNTRRRGSTVAAHSRNAARSAWTVARSCSAGRERFF